MPQSARRCPDPDCARHEVDTGAPFCADCGTRTELPAVAAVAPDPRFMSLDVVAGLPRGDEPADVVAAVPQADNRFMPADVLWGPRSFPQPAAAGQPPYAPAAAPPSTTATILITLVFGLFGLIPAAIATTTEAAAGRPTNRYWAAFGWTLAVSFTLGVVLVLLLLVAV